MLVKQQPDEDDENRQRKAKYRQRQVALQKQIADALKRVLSREDVNRAELAEKSCITVQAVSAWQTTGKAALLGLIDIADMTGLSLDEVTGRHTSRPMQSTETGGYIDSRWASLGPEAQITLFKVMIAELGRSTERRKRDKGPPTGIADRRRLTIRKV